MMPAYLLDDALPTCLMMPCLMIPAYLLDLTACLPA